MFTSHKAFYASKIPINTKWQIPALERDEKMWAERKREEKRREVGGGGLHTVMTQEL